MRRILQRLFQIFSKICFGFFVTVSSYYFEHLLINNPQIIINSILMRPVVVGKGVVNHAYGMVWLFEGYGGLAHRWIDNLFFIAQILYLGFENLECWACLFSTTAFHSSKWKYAYFEIATITINISTSFINLALLQHPVSALYEHFRTLFYFWLFIHNVKAAK